MTSKTRCGRGLDCSGLGERELAGSCENGNEQSCSTKFAEVLPSWWTVKFSRMYLLHGANYVSVLLTNI